MGKATICKSLWGIFHHSQIFSIWQCHNSNGSATLSYSSKCEDRHGIALPKKFPHCLSEIIQSSFLHYMGMLHKAYSQENLIKRSMNQLKQLLSTRLAPCHLENLSLLNSLLCLFKKEKFIILTNWTLMIVNYLKDPNVSVDRKTRHRALSYVLLNDILYKNVDEMT